MEKIAELEIEFEDEINEELGVDTISLVNDPAIQIGFHAFNNECGDECELDHLREEIIKFAEDDSNGLFITPDDVIIDLNKTQFISVKEVLDGLRAFDILKRLGIKKNEDPKVYYRYTGPSPQRRFCQAMMRLANSGKIFSQEEIDRMASLNPGFGIRGANSYDIFKYCGGVNCRHFWSKVKVFQQKDGPKVIMVSDPETAAELLAAKSQNINYPSPYGAIEKNARYTFSTIDEDQRIVLGPVLIPNQKILRMDENGNPYYVFFRKDTIKKIAEKWFRDHNQNRTDIDHNQKKTEENTLLESWISESEEHDKSVLHGFKLPIGTWFVSYRINDEDTWGKIKRGEIQGFSMEGQFYEKFLQMSLEKEIIDIISSIDLPEKK
jgi:hypothetical protein